MHARCDRGQPKQLRYRPPGSVSASREQSSPSAAARSLEPSSRRRSSLVSRKPAPRTAAAAPAAATVPPAPPRSPSRTLLPAACCCAWWCLRCGLSPGACGRSPGLSLCRGRSPAGSSAATSSSLLYATRLMTAAAVRCAEVPIGCPTHRRRSDLEADLPTGSRGGRGSGCLRSW